MKCSRAAHYHGRGAEAALSALPPRRGSEHIPSQPPLLLARGERRSARDTQRSRAQRARKKARAFWWGARSALGAPGLVTEQTDNPATEYVAPAPSSSHTAHASLTNYLAPAPDVIFDYVAPHRTSKFTSDFSEAHLSVWKELLHLFSARSTTNRSLQGRRHRTS